jgi:rubrerythrin
MDLKSFGEIIEFAISREEAAIKVYGDMSEQAQSSGLKELLLELQGEEKNHKELLENISDAQIQAFEIKEVPDLKISDYLTDEKPKEDITFQKLLVFAAKKEQEAVDLYSNLEQNADDAELKKLFQFLVQQEKNHKLKLETEYEKRVLADD